MIFKPFRLHSITLLLILSTATVASSAEAAAATKKKIVKRAAGSAVHKTTGSAVHKKATSTHGAVRHPAARRSIVIAAPAAVASGGTFEERLASLINSSVASNSIASIQVAEVDTGRVVGERNPHLPVAPASNMKLFTTGAALDLLGGDFEYKTAVYLRGAIDATGTLHGDVKVVGRGDPTIGGRFNDGNGAAVPERWARELKEAGVKTIAGNLIFEYGYFDTEYTHPSWPTNQLVNWYEAPVAALSMQEGCVMVRINPSHPGEHATVSFEPKNSFVTLQNSCVTGGGRGIFVTRQIGTNDIIVRGSVPPRAGNSDIFVTIQDPIHYFANVTHDAFERGGVHTQGQVVTTPHDDRPDWKFVAEHRTPLQIVMYVINKKSQNHFAEQLLKTVGAEVKKDGSFKGGSAAISEWLTTKVGVPAAEYSQIDGSGMSRFNRVTSSSFIQLLRYMWTTPYRNVFLSSMPYSGEPESRLRRRLNQPPFARQVYAKTGYIVGVIGLSGYVHAQSGKIYAFSFLFNRYPSGVSAVYHLQEEILKEVIRGG